MAKPAREHHKPRPPTRLASRPKYRAARAFYIFLCIATCLAAYSLFSHSYGPSAGYRERALYTRNVETPLKPLSSDEECRLVHTAVDQCAYIRAHCPADEGGFTAYLELYFCRLHNAKPVAFLVLVSWLGVLFSTIGIAASDFFCIDLSTISGILGMSESVAGVTFLAFGNGSPDVFSTFAAMSTDSGSLAVGELFGAAGFITAVVAGSMALIRPFHVARKSFIRDVGFFTVAAAFSMVFLWDGRLHFWECASMVVYYIFYVAFVVGWHWWLGRKKQRREKEAAVRSHFVPVEDELDNEYEEYRDDPDEAPDSSRPSISRGASREDWAALEAGSSRRADDGDEDVEEEERDKWMSELASNMRLTRPTRSRRNTVTPVRPSLVGALEFQSVLKSLQKSRNIQTIPLDSRRYSDDPTFTTAQQQEQLSSTSDPAARPPYEILVTTEDDEPHAVQPHIEQRELEVPHSAPAGRTRAVSANDAAALRVNPDLQKLSPIPSSENLAHLDRSMHKKTNSLTVPSVDGAHAPASPLLQIEPASPRGDAPVQRQRSKTDVRPSPALLTPEDARGRPSANSDYFYSSARQDRSSSAEDRSQPARVPSARTLLKIIIPGKDRSPGSSRSTSPFPAYRDFPSPSVTGSDRSPLSTRAPSMFSAAPQLSSIVSPESIAADESAEQERPRRPDRLARIWPYSVLPPPGVMIQALFPTIYHWGEKTWYGKCLGAVAAPSVFLLTITLPVVENEKESETSGSISEHPHKDMSWDSTRSRSNTALLTPTSGGIQGLTPEWMHDPETPHPHGVETQGVTGHGSSASAAVHAEQSYHTKSGAISSHHGSIVAEPRTLDNTQPGDLESAPELWNRWLTLIQLFTAPIMIVLSIYIQAPDGLPTSWLVRAILICLLVSLVLLVPILLTTTPYHLPEPYRIILSLAGFVVAIAWISAIAAQVVGALKALAVILNMSHAIMGLTIFAVGNSLGDLVADVTVAKLGYPVMALSACFGGPMLNILLGIGLSGSYILIKGAERRHEKHPGKHLKFHSYHMEVSKTLIVSGITLLLTLVGLLIAVPLNKWVLSRKIGWCLIALWTVSTIFNVVIEVTGILGGAESIFHIGHS
ncbi:putative cation exchanger [Cercospora beticola]|uniref:Putative cation exchanger n=1 Tax=Cercospora beticola TaxID=122368 RepID=A0A2G5HFA0_CERBT|nr:putative cation exchanger [Cercospora beticola]PIA90913.1 putative cation exchanger [Cercospora beticola]WPB08115.1 hypothetical protein RHO25_012779 [Cercospora beticola]